MRIVMAQLGPQGIRPMDQRRVCDIRSFLQWTQGDILGGQECNVNWNNIPKEHWPQELFRSEVTPRCQTALKLGLGQELERLFVYVLLTSSMMRVSRMSD